MLYPACWMVKEIGGQKNGRGPRDSIRLVRMVRTIGGQIWLHAPLTWPDGNGDAADYAGHQSDSPSGRAGWSRNAQHGRPCWPSI